jgi:hypothetical protein
MKVETRGRKPIANQLKKVPVTIYVCQSDVDNNGGKETLKSKLLKYVTTNTKRLQQTGTC